MFEVIKLLLFLLIQQHNQWTYNDNLLQLAIPQPESQVFIQTAKYLLTACTLIYQVIITVDYFMFT